MAKKKTAAPKHVEPEEESQGVPEEEPETEPASSGMAISKADAVREALAQGKEGPEEGTDYIRSQYGIEMTRQSFSSYKAQEKARQAKKQSGAPPKGKRGRKPSHLTPDPRQSRKDAPPIEHYFAPSLAVESAGEAGFIEALEAMKPLVERLGAEKVKRLVDLLG